MQARKAKDAHGLDWMGLTEVLDPTQKFLLVGLVTQPNSKFSQPNPLFSGWVVRLLKKKLTFLKTLFYP